MARVACGVGDTMLSSSALCVLAAVLYSLVTTLQANVYSEDPSYSSPSFSSSSSSSSSEWDSPQLETNTCPLTLKVNHSNHCQCTGLGEIYCFQLDAIPVFTVDDNVYNGIYMQRQDISEIPSNAFFKLQVKKIVLDFNALGDKIPGSALSGLEGILQELSMGSCKIRRLHRALLSGMIQLRYLHLWGNEIRTIPANFFNHATDLVEILLWGNRITNLHDDSFSGLRKLEKLDLDDNRITSLGKEMFRHLDSLLALHLGQNHIRTIPEETFAPLGQLRVLTLDHNGLQYVWPTAFKGLKSLLSLSLNNNGISIITDEVFSSMKNLSSLYLQNNELQNSLWARHFGSLHSLKLLDLSGNKATELVDGTFKPIPTLKYLYLDNNELSHLFSSMFDSGSQLKILSLVGNPMDCNCDLSWLMELAQRGTNVWGSCNNTVVGYPTSLTDKLNYMSPNLNCYSTSDSMNGSYT